MLRSLQRRAAQQYHLEGSQLQATANKWYGPVISSRCSFNASIGPSRDINFLSGGCDALHLSEDDCGIITESRHDQIKDGPWRLQPSLFTRPVRSVATGRRVFSTSRKPPPFGRQNTLGFKYRQRQNSGRETKLGNTTAQNMIRPSVSVRAPSVSLNLQQADHINKLLQHIGSKKEVEQYLKTYTQGDSKFAVIKIGGGVLVHQLEELVDSLTFLHNVGLKPIVLHGAGPQLNARLASIGYESNYIEGLRITDATVMKHAREVFAQENNKLVRALEEAGTPARPMVHNVFEAVDSGRPELGYVGAVTGVNVEMIENAVTGGYLPVLTCLASTAEGQLLNVNADLAAKALADALKPMKVIYISEKGGIYDENGDIMSSIDVGADYERLMGSAWFKYGDRLKLKHFKLLLEELPRSSSIVVTHVDNLAKELFTHKGAGTLITNWEQIKVFNNLDEVNRHRLRSVIEDAFGGKLVPEYFRTLIKNKFNCVHISEHYNAAAVILDGENGMFPDDVAILDKFVVGGKTQSAGMASRLWDSMMQNHPKLVWRARAENPINDWYFKRATGAVTVPGPDGKDWRVFWYGIDNLDDLPGCIRSVLAGPPTIRYEETVRYADFEQIQQSETPVRRIGIIGARGYTGAEIVRILDNHPNMELVRASSRKWEGRRVSDIVEGSTCDVIFQNITVDQLKEHSNGIDTWILALPNGVAAEYVRAMPPNVRIVDLSADFRFSSLDYVRQPRTKISASDLPAEEETDDYWQYGLPERKGNRAKIANAQYVSNPGCYATGAQIGLLPLLAGGDIRVIGVPRVFGVSGYSGAGADPNDKNDPDRLRTNLIPYALAGHMHEQEVSHQLSEWLEQDTIAFSPHVAEFFRGIHLTISVDIVGKPNLNAGDVYRLFKDYYEDEPFVQIQRAAPEVQNVANTHGVMVGGFTLSPDKRRLTFVSVIDNLLKGAASQAVQNLNIMNGLNELEGLQPLKHYMDNAAVERLTGVQDKTCPPYDVAEATHQQVAQTIASSDATLQKRSFRTHARPGPVTTGRRSFNTSIGPSEGNLPIKLDNEKLDGTASGDTSVRSPEHESEKGQFEIHFTCNKCETRSKRKFSKRAYHKGLVIVRCGGCEVLHLIADNCGVFSDTNTNIEQILEEMGEKVKHQDGIYTLDPS